MFELRRATVSVALLGLTAALPIASASAAEKAVGPVGSETVGSGTWGVVPTQSTSVPPPTGPLSVTATTNAAQYFKAVNVGTLSLVAMDYVVSFPGAGSTTMTLTACSVAWNTGGGGSCGGTKTTIGIWSNKTPVPNGDVASGASVSSSVVPATGNGQVSIQAKPGGVPGGGTTFTINTLVSSASPRQIRAAQTTNS